jgi:hypothetical protein
MGGESRLRKHDGVDPERRKKTELTMAHKSNEEPEAEE